jgi:hypothetical protein
MAALDVYQPREGNKDVDSIDFDWDHQGNLLEQRSQEFFQGGNAEYAVLRVEAGTAGAARIELEHGFWVEIFPADSRKGEQWRLFQPTSDEGLTTTDGTHVVVVGDGVVIE